MPIVITVCFVGKVSDAHIRHAQAQMKQCELVSVRREPGAGSQSIRKMKVQSVATDNNINIVVVSSPRRSMGKLSRQNRAQRLEKNATVTRRDADAIQTTRPLTDRGRSG